MTEADDVNDLLTRRDRMESRLLALGERMGALQEQERRLATRRMAIHAGPTVDRSALADIEDELSRLEDRKTIFTREYDRLRKQQSEVGEQLDEARLRAQAARIRELEEEISRFAPVIESQREALGRDAAGELSDDYTAQADKHAKAWKQWGVLLLIAVVGTFVVGYLLFDEDHVPAGKLSNGTVVEIARNLVLIGLALYLVRLASLQFRVHRHLEAVSRSKATALSTFNRMTGIASEPEIRNSLAVVLAQAVFASDDTGFVDAGGNHVTLAEGAIASALTKK